MGLLRQIPARVAGQTILIPVVGLGESPLRSFIFAQVGSTKGEVALVDPDDVRASKAIFSMGGVKYAIAKDYRRQITHTGPWTGTSSVSVGTTTFNRVTEIRANIEASASLHCNAVHVAFDPLECLTLEVRIKAGSYTSSWQLRSQKCGRHYGEFQSNSFSHSISGTVVLSGLPPGTYSVTVELQVTLTQEGSGAGISSRSLKVSSWTEYA